MMDWLTNAENYVNGHPQAAIALIAVVAILILAAWLWGPVLLTSRRKYETRKDRVEDTDRYRRYIGQVLTVPVLVVAALYTLHEAAQAARESAEKSQQEKYSFGFQTLADGNITTRLGGVYALAQLMGGERQDILCPDGIVRPLSGDGGLPRRRAPPSSPSRTSSTGWRWTASPPTPSPPPISGIRPAGRRKRPRMRR